MTSQRIVAADYYMCSPVNNLDDYDFVNVKDDGLQVPVIRVFGALQSGEKTCCHVHNVVPYMYVLLDDTKTTDNDPFDIDDYISNMAKSIDFSLNYAIGDRDDHSKKAPRVYKILPIMAFPFYGYHKDKLLFLKIFLYKPSDIKKLSDLFLAGIIMNKIFQPYEAHIPYILQMFIDYNLYGMNFMNFTDFKVRPSTGKSELPRFHGNYEDNQNAGGDSFSDRLNTWISTLDDCLDDPGQLLDISSIDRNKILRSTVRHSRSSLEIDVKACHITNKDIKKEVGTNPGLTDLWNDELQRRQNLNLSLSPIDIPFTPDRGCLPPSAGEYEQLDKFKEVLNVLQPFIENNWPHLQATQNLFNGDHLLNTSTTPDSLLDVSLSQKSNPPSHTPPTASQSSMPRFSDSQYEINENHLIDCITSSQSFSIQNSEESGDHFDDITNMASERNLSLSPCQVLDPLAAEIEDEDASSFSLANQTLTGGYHDNDDDNDDCSTSTTIGCLWESNTREIDDFMCQLDGTAGHLVREVGHDEEPRATDTMCKGINGGSVKGFLDSEDGRISANLNRLTHISPTPASPLGKRLPKDNQKSTKLHCKVVEYGFKRRGCCRREEGGRVGNGRNALIDLEVNLEDQNVIVLRERLVGDYRIPQLDGQTDDTDNDIDMESNQASKTPDNNSPADNGSPAAGKNPRKDNNIRIIQYSGASHFNEKHIKKNSNLCQFPRINPRSCKRFGFHYKSILDSTKSFFASGAMTSISLPRQESKATMVTIDMSQVVEVQEGLMFLETGSKEPEVHGRVQKARRGNLNRGLGIPYGRKIAKAPYRLTDSSYNDQEHHANDDNDGGANDADANDTEQVNLDSQYEIGSTISNKILSTKDIVKGFANDLLNKQNAIANRMSTVQTSEIQDHDIMIDYSSQKPTPIIAPSDPGDMVATAMNATLYDDPPEGQTQNQQHPSAIDHRIGNQQQQQHQQQQQQQQSYHQIHQQPLQNNQLIISTTSGTSPRVASPTKPTTFVPQLDGIVDQLSPVTEMNDSSPTATQTTTIDSTSFSRGYPVERRPFSSLSHRGGHRQFSRRRDSAHFPSRHHFHDDTALAQYDGAFDDLPTCGQRPQRQVTLTGRTLPHHASHSTSSSSNNTSSTSSGKRGRSKRTTSTSTHPKKAAKILARNSNTARPGHNPLLAHHAPVAISTSQSHASPTPPSMMHTPVIHLAANCLPPSRQDVIQHTLATQSCQSLTSKHARLDTCTCVPQLTREPNR